MGGAPGELASLHIIILHVQCAPRRKRPGPVGVDTPPLSSITPSVSGSFLLFFFSSFFAFVPTWQMVWRKHIHGGTCYSRPSFLFTCDGLDMRPDISLPHCGEGNYLRRR